MKDSIPSGNLSPFQGDHRGSSNPLPSRNLSPFQEDPRGSGGLNYFSSIIRVGAVPLGGDYPVRLQSMTNTDTLDTKASVAQCIRIIEAGADFVRLTAQGTREAQNLAEIKKELRKAGFETPLIADIHFNPAAAETAARLVEKVRINPGNYNDKRASFHSVDLTDKEYNEELDRIHSRLLPLINICREYGTVIRVGINHGSLSDRIMTRYGNTPEGMVQSALEFIDVFRQENFGNLVLSMKSSDTAVMVMATRMLVAMMQKNGVAYPLHLGVTEAGEGEDGRIRSAAGIGALLSDRIGDTIRVSLSEDPEKEIPVAKKIIAIFPRNEKNRYENSLVFNTSGARPEIFSNINGPLVLADLRRSGKFTEKSCVTAGFKISANEIVKTDSSADLILANIVPSHIPEGARIAVPYTTWRLNRNVRNVFPFFTVEEYHEHLSETTALKLILIDAGSDISSLTDLSESNTLVIFSYSATEYSEAEKFLEMTQQKNLKAGIILNPVLNEENTENLSIRSASILGKYVIDNSIAGLMITSNADKLADETVKTAFSILQCTDKRITRTIYLSCPTCGRTKFNLQETVIKVKEATGHLKGLKIAVMGCIVNGPGEMAGADYGYVGAAPGKVHIYKGTTAVLKNVPEEDAIKELLRVIETSHASL